MGVQRAHGWALLLFTIVIAQRRVAEGDLEEPEPGLVPALGA